MRTAWPHVQVIEMGRNAGFAAATNAGIRACESDLVLLLNSDTIVPPGSIDRLAGALDDDPAAAAAGPRLVGLDGTVELSFGRMLSPWNEARQRLITLGLARRLGPVVRWFERQVSTPHHPEWVSGACLLVRRAAGAAAGWLDERFFLYGEDVDLCAALRAAGHRVLFTPASEIIHARADPAPPIRPPRARPTGAARSRSTASTTRAGPALCASTCARAATTRRRYSLGAVRVAIDVRKLKDFGIGTYVRNLVRQLARLDHETDYVLLCRRDDADFAASLGENFRTITQEAPNYSISEQFTVPLSLGAAAPHSSMRRTTCCPH